MSRYREHRVNWTLRIFLLWLALARSHEGVAPSHHRSTPDASTLQIKPRESEVSITLGKDLVLGPPLATEAPIVANFSVLDGVLATTKLDSPANPTSRVSSGERGASGPAVPKDASPPRWSPHNVPDNRYRAGKGSKTARKRDSYLEALTHSHTSDDPREGIVRTDSRPKAIRREYASGPIYKPETEYGSPDSTYPWKGPRIAYGGPSVSTPVGDSYSQSFRPAPTLDYNGPPQNSHGPPQNTYGPPQSSYGPPLYPQTPYGSSGNTYSSSQPGYGTVIHTSPPAPIYSAPYALPDASHISILPTFDLGWPLALKLNAFTIAKIILKLVIFKMIVKFIAVICLLLFIPKLEIIKKKGNKDEDDEEERSLSSPYASSQTLNDLESTVKSSVEKYEEQNDARSNSTRRCTTLECRVAEALTFRDESWNDYLNLFKSYVEEERQITKREGQ